MFEFTSHGNNLYEQFTLCFSKNNTSDKIPDISYNNKIWQNNNKLKTIFKICVQNIIYGESTVNQIKSMTAAKHVNAPFANKTRSTGNSHIWQNLYNCLLRKTGVYESKFEQLHFNNGTSESSNTHNNRNHSIYQIKQKCNSSESILIKSVLKNGKENITENYQVNVTSNTTERFADLKNFEVAKELNSLAPSHHNFNEHQYNMTTNSSSRDILFFHDDESTVRTEYNNLESIEDDEQDYDTDYEEDLKNS